MSPISHEYKSDLENNQNSSVHDESLNSDDFGIWY